MLKAPVVLAAVAVLASQAALAGPRVQDVRFVPKDGGVDVVVTASEPLTFQSWAQKSPAAIIVDLLETEASPASKAGAGPVQALQITRHDARGVPMTRLTLPLAAPQNYEVDAHGNTITISVFGAGIRAPKSAAMDVSGAIVPAATPVKVASVDDRHNGGGIQEGEIGRATASDALFFAQAGGARQMTYIGMRANAAQTRVFARMNDNAEFSVRKEGDNLVILEIKNATIPLRNNKNHLDASYFDNSPVKMITPSEIEDASPTIRIAIEMKGSVPFETKVEGREIAIYFKR